MKKILFFCCFCQLALLVSQTDFSVQGNYDLWEKAVRGKNLAAGRKIEFSHKPEYRLTKSDSDPYDLTDGKLSDHKTGRIWFDSAAVGWLDSSTASGINLLIDLGQNERVGRVVARLLGGAAQNSLIFPRKIAIYISKDGKEYYESACLEKLMSGEKSQSDFVKYFYLPEEGAPYTYPFVLNVNAEARYVIIRIWAATHTIFSDEIAIIEAGGESATEFNAPYRGTAEQLPMAGITVGPRIGKLVLTDNISTPNLLTINAMCNTKNQKTPIEVIVETPDTVILENPIIEPEKITVDNQKRHRFRIQEKQPVKYNLGQPLFFKATGKLPENAVAVIYARCGDEPVWPQNFPIEVISIPEIKPPYQGFPIDLTWMTIQDQQKWPNFFEDWHKLGFDAVACFPRYYNTPEEQSELARYLDDARKKGYKVVVNESPFFMMKKLYAGDRDIYSHRVDGKENTDLCPSYRGEQYRKELERVAGVIRLTKPDRVYWDIECWYRGAMDAVNKQCIRCNEAVAASGQDVHAYLRQCGVRMLKDLKNAVREGMDGKPMPLVASYNHHASNQPHHYLFAGLDLYPDFIDQFQPSLYVGGRAELIHRSIRHNYLSKNPPPRIFPWLSAGTYGEFDPAKLEYMIYETLLNGAEGFGYYAFRDFDTPMDYYYHAKALSTLAPYQKLLKNGKVLQPQGRNTKLFYSGVMDRENMLLLIGNYLKEDENTAVELPFRPAVIKDLLSGENIPGSENLELTVPKDKIRLLYISGN